MEGHDVIYVPPSASFCNPSACFGGPSKTCLVFSGEHQARHGLIKKEINTNCRDCIEGKVLSSAVFRSLCRRVVSFSVFSVWTPAVGIWSDAPIPLVNAGVIDGDS